MPVDTTLSKIAICCNLNDVSEDRVLNISEQLEQGNPRHTTRGGFYLIVALV
jgi:hypothetical protein